MASAVEAVSLDGLAGSINVHLSALEGAGMTYGEMQQLAEQAEAGWQGQAGQNFKQALDAWLANYKQVHDYVDLLNQKMSAHLKTTTQTHEDTSSATSSLVSGMTTPIGLQGF
ncbi:hypothetical protein [Streptomyces bauhiniae]|uniref:hypothetical protein n=1 Tax=Streptomyces bauhiniae TaxID=2340725 RepID=UPI0035D58F83